MDFVETSLMLAAVLIYPKNLTMFFVAAIATRFLNALVCNVMGFLEMKKELWVHRHADNNLLSEEFPVIRKYVLNNSYGNTIKAFMQQGDVLLLGTLAGTVSVGFYSVAKKLAYALLTVTDPLVNSIYPQISKLISEKKVADLQKMLVRITQIAALPAVLFLITGYFLNSWIITRVYGAGYLPASYPFFFLLINAVFGAVTFWVLPLMQSLGLVKLRLKVYSLMIVAGSAIACFAVPLAQATGMAIALLAVNIGINTIFILASKKELKLSSANSTL
jgi:O-antigen/teichoic acid export membrane protein